MHSTRLAAAALAATAFTLSAPASPAATLVQTYTTLTSEFIGFAGPGSSTDTFILINATGVTWQSFRLQVSPSAALITGGFSGPIGSFAIIDNGGINPTATVLAGR